MSDESTVFFHRGDDPVIMEASDRARQTFRDFWYQVALDFNRIIPALELSCLKVPFSDDFSDPEAPVEHMWLQEIDFDGLQVSGLLLNSPNWLTSVNEGDRLAFPLAQISDWLCMLEGKVYGAHTIQVMRAQMDGGERAQHDEAWGLPFAPPETVLVPPRNYQFEGVIAQLIAEQIAKDPAVVNTVYDEGRTLLHLEALYGREASVAVLLDHGAAADHRCERGWRPLEYAQSLGWDDVASMLA